jgi:hypothetical protein
MQELKFLQGKYLQAYPVGSKVTCKPPPTDTDTDILVKVEDIEVFACHAELLGYGQSHRASRIAPSPPDSGSMAFVSLRREDDNVNLIVTASDEFVRKFLAATSVARRLNLLDKRDRIALFQAVLYANVVPVPAIPEPTDDLFSF